MPPSPRFSLAARSRRLAIVIALAVTGPLLFGDRGLVSSWLAKVYAVPIAHADVPQTWWGGDNGCCNCGSCDGD